MTSSEDEDSLDFLMYKHLLDHRIRGGVLPNGLRELLKETQPERFDLKKIAQIFDAWYTAFQKKETELKKPWFPVAANVVSANRQRDYLEYHYDNLTWRADDWIQCRRDGGLVLNIKLANDGFLYKSRDQMETLGDELISQHQCGGWVLLDITKYLEHFEGLMRFAEWWTGTSSTLKYIVLYNYSHDRLDFKAFDDEHDTQVTITYERFQPVSELKDYWRKIALPPKKA